MNSFKAMFQGFFLLLRHTFFKEHLVFPAFKDNFQWENDWGNSPGVIFWTPDEMRYTNFVTIVGLIYSIQV